MFVICVFLLVVVVKAKQNTSWAVSDVICIQSSDEFT
jgi:hypothetical protein